MKRFILFSFCLLCPLILAGGGKKSEDGKSSSRLTDEKIPLNIESVPDRVKPIIELGEPYLGTGTLSPGFELPTGAVWQPALLVFGTFRTAVQSNGYNPALGDARVSEGVARLDLSANLQLSGSERLVIGFRNLDQEGRFTGEIFDSDNPSIPEGSQDELNAEVGTLFFEGDFGEIFPNLSPRDFKPTDVGLAIGRQPISFQEGILINDTIDGIGLTWNSLQPKKSSNLRTTFFYGWNNVNRNNSANDGGELFGLFTSIDYRKSTVDLDLLYHAAEDNMEDLMAFGVSAIQRFGLVNTSFRLLGSMIDDSNDQTNGYLAFSEISYTPHYSHNLVYFNSFAALDTFTPAAMGPGNGGPLGRAGIGFAGVGIGNYGAPLSATASEVIGGAVGYQMFFDHTRKQMIFELATRLGTTDAVLDQYAATVRYQMAMGRRFVLVVDGFANLVESFDDDTYYGGRIELQVRF